MVGHRGNSGRGCSGLITAKFTRGLAGRPGWPCAPQTWREKLGENVVPLARPGLEGFIGLCHVNIKATLQLWDRWRNCRPLEEPPTRNFYQRLLNVTKPRRWLSG